MEMQAIHRLQEVQAKLRQAQTDLDEKPIESVAVQCDCEVKIQELNQEF
jgi:hypothetical protein